MCDLELQSIYAQFGVLCLFVRERSIASQDADLEIGVPGRKETQEPTRRTGVWGTPSPPQEIGMSYVPALRLPQAGFLPYRAGARAAARCAHSCFKVANSASMCSVRVRKLTGLIRK
jgi:hypothetical protein